LTSTNPGPGARGASKVLLARLFRGYIGKHWGKLTVAMLAMAVVALTTAAYARIMQPLTDLVFVERDPTDMILVPLAFLAIAVIKGLATYIQSYLMGVFGQRIIADVQNSLFAHLIRADIAFFHATATGGLISSFLNDANLLREALNKALTGIAKDSLTLIFLVGVLFWTDWKLAFVATVVLPLAILPIRTFGKRTRKASTQNQERTGEFSSLLGEAFAGARHIKAYGMEAHETERARQANERRLAAMFKVIRARAASAPTVEALGGLAAAAVVFYAAGFGDVQNRMTAGEFFTFITALGLAYQPLRSLANLNTALQEGLAAAQRIFAMLDTEAAIKDAPGAAALRVEGGAVRFDAVAHAYTEGAPALRGISFEVPAGQTVALVGPSGAGKSTVLNLIPRFYDADEGAVTIDGQDVRAVTQASLRAAIGLVSQESTLFNDTIRANIAYGRPGATDDEIVAAARAAAAHDFITGLPAGYNTMVGESGLKLSGGQRQRIAIARAVLKDAPILLLDEATSALDSDSERQVQDALKRLSEGRTTLVVAHRLSTVIDADKIVVLDDGRIVASGTHAELLARGGLYARLYALQGQPDDRDAPARAQA
jgi:subfamily B ATP-binding cassette protein MsbA